jgi:dTDP-4-dehydrorhamnose 3,5-epimerase
LRCPRGAIFDVLVDVRPGSPAFGHWEAFELNDDNHRQLYAPDGFAHGFCVLSDTADVIYKCSTYYDPVRESGFRYNDPDVGIPWPTDLDLQASARDREAPRLRELEGDLPFAEPA